MITGPARVVIRTFGVPNHDIWEAEIAALTDVHRASRKHVGAVHPESSGQRAKVTSRVTGRVPSRNRPATGCNRPACGVNAHAVSTSVNSPEYLSVDEGRPERATRRRNRPECGARTPDASGRSLRLSWRNTPRRVSSARRKCEAA